MLRFSLFQLGSALTSISPNGRAAAGVIFSRNLCEKAAQETGAGEGKEAGKEAEPTETPDFYRVLGVPKSADLTRIKQAYLKKASFWHPDKNSHTPDLAKRKFAEVQDAYAVLSDERYRRAFDMGKFTGFKERTEVKSGY